MNVIRNAQHETIADHRQVIMVVAADRSRARLFLIPENGDELLEVADLVNSAARTPENELTRDRQGRGLYGGIHGKHGKRTAYGKSGAKRYSSAEAFAASIVEQINAHMNSGSMTFKQIYLIANPELMGLLRPQLHTLSEKYPIIEIAKNITRQEKTAIRDYLPKALWPRRVSGVRLN